MKKVLTCTIQEALAQPLSEEIIQLHGWVRNRRLGKKMTFITLQDGSTQEALQIVAPSQELSEALRRKLHIGCSLQVMGQMVASQGGEQSREVQAHQIRLLGASSADYPLQPKPHSLSFLRGWQHLRFRTHTFRAVFAIRHTAAFAMHTFLHERRFFCIHTPVITDIDAEGAGETFQVTTPPHEREKPFFGTPAHLTVSGQLAVEAAAMGMGKVYTFGPAFRAENSHTTRHLAEFWMIEPEMAFYDLHKTIALAQDFLQFIIRYVSQHCQAEIAFLSRRMEQELQGEEKKSPLHKRLAALVHSPFHRITYTAALTLLQTAAQQNPQRFVYPVAPWGVDLQKEHENYLTHHFGGAVVVTDYPATQKPFYMRQNEDGRTVSAMDILLPHIGEIIGGSQREERYDHLRAAMQKQGLDVEKMNWYLDTRRFGSVPHSGFGLGFERLLQCLTGMDNIRDVIPYPRTQGHMQY